MKSKYTLKKFLDSLRKYGNLEGALAVAGISLATYYRYRKKDPEFAEMVYFALEEGKESLIPGNMVPNILGATYLSAISEGPSGYKDRKLLLNLAGFNTKEKVSLGPDTTPLSGSLLLQKIKEEVAERKRIRKEKERKSGSI